MLILILLSLDRGESATVDLDLYVTLKKNTGTFGIMINYCDVVVEVRLWGSGGACDWCAYRVSDDGV